MNIIDKISNYSREQLEFLRELHSIKRVHLNEEEIIKSLEASFMASPFYISECRYNKYGYVRQILNFYISVDRKLL